MFANRSYIHNIGPEFCVWGCDIDRACEGYITSEDTKQGSYMQYIWPISILYTNYCMMVTSPAWCAHGRSINNINSSHQSYDVTIILRTSLNSRCVRRYPFLRKFIYNSVHKTINHKIWRLKETIHFLKKRYLRTHLPFNQVLTISSWVPQRGVKEPQTPVCLANHASFVESHLCKLQALHGTLRK